MNINLNIPNYDGNALDVIWGKNAHYSIHTYENHVVLSANKDGLISLAKQMWYTLMGCSYSLPAVSSI